MRPILAWKCLSS